MNEKLKLVAVGGEFGGPMVPDYEAQAVGQRRYIGRRLDPTLGVEFKDTVDGSTKRHAVFVTLEGEEAIVVKPFETANRGEYIRHMRGGDLLPGDQFTASCAGVAFDPKFVGAAAQQVGAAPAPAPKPADPPAPKPSSSLPSVAELAKK